MKDFILLDCTPRQNPALDQINQTQSTRSLESMMGPRFLSGQFDHGLPRETGHTLVTESRGHLAVEDHEVLSSLYTYIVVSHKGLKNLSMSLCLGTSIPIALADHKTRSVSNSIVWMRESVSSPVEHKSIAWPS